MDQNKNLASHVAQCLEQALIVELPGIKALYGNNFDSFILYLDAVHGSQIDETFVNVGLNGGWPSELVELASPEWKLFLETLDKWCTWRKDHEGDDEVVETARRDLIFACIRVLKNLRDRGHFNVDEKTIQKLLVMEQEDGADGTIAYQDWTDEEKVYGNR